MLIGRELEFKILTQLKEKNLLSGSFLFFGESQIGKFSLIESFTSAFENNPLICQERLIITPGDSKIGINEIKKIKFFLHNAPILSNFRSVIIDSANKMTTEAQNAVLKIVEEAPSYAFIIFITQDSDTLLPTLSSRLRKIYFSRVKNELIMSWLQENYNVSKTEAQNIADVSFGRPGLALELINKKDFLQPPQIPIKFDSVEEYEQFIKYSLIYLYQNKESNWKLIKKIINKMELSSKFNLNKKLQIQSISWTH